MSAPVAIITGANRGIGLEAARQLHTTGWTVLIGSRDPENGERAAQSIALDDRRPIAVQLDVTDPASVENAAAEASKRYGRVDALVNNAAIMYDASARAVTADLETVRRAMETNLFGAWRTAQAFVPLLRRSEHPRIVNVSSEGGSISGMHGGTPAYSTSKAALNAHAPARERTACRPHPRQRRLPGLDRHRHGRRRTPGRRRSRERPLGRRTG